MALDRVSCSICLESLFNYRDDLDETLPIAAPDCGHVFHEKCIHDWFESQASTYVAQQREHRGRSVSPSDSEAPAECPTCRTECYADPNTGIPMTHRLFIPFGEGFGSSQMGSSPTRTPWRNVRGKGKDAEVMGFARRAKGLGEEVGDLIGEAEVGEDEVGAVTRRVEGLEKDLVSQKAVEGIRKYVGGLTAALNNLRTSLATHPLIPALRAQVLQIQEAQADTQEEIDRFRKHVMPEQIKAIRVAQRELYEKELKKVKDDMEMVKAALQKETVLRRTGRREMDDRLQEEVKKTAEALDLARREKADREALGITLAERTRLMCAFRDKAELRKVSKSHLGDLEKENARLKAELQDLSATASRSRRTTNQDEASQSSHIALFNTYGDMADHSDSEIEQHGSINSAKGRDTEDRAQDDSLVVVMPPLASSSPSRHFVDAESYLDVGRPRPQPTARTIGSELFAGTTGNARGSKRGPQSKYFISNASIAGSADLSRQRPDDNPSPAKRSRTNPFPASRADTDRKKILPSATSNVMRGQPNFETVDITSSPESTGKGFRQDRSIVNDTRPVMVPTKKPVLKQKSLVEQLGLVDKLGRPVKTLVNGAKVKRKV